MPLMRSSTAWRAPLPTASIAMTEATPMTMPSSVSAVRKTFEERARAAAFAASSQPRTGAAGRSVLRRQGAPAVGCGPGSRTTWPSRISITRWACAATSAEWVITMTVWPCRARSSSSARTSAPLVLSSAPVGSSARTIWPPFMSARAMETRCCWPPESWFGLCSSRSASPSIVSSERARSRRGPGAVPA